MQSLTVNARNSSDCNAKSITTADSTWPTNIINGWHQRKSYERGIIDCISHTVLHRSEPPGASLVERYDKGHWTNYPQLTLHLHVTLHMFICRLLELHPHVQCYLRPYLQHGADVLPRFYVKWSSVLNIYHNIQKKWVLTYCRFWTCLKPICRTIL